MRRPLVFIFAYKYGLQAWREARKQPLYFREKVIRPCCSLKESLKENPRKGVFRATAVLLSGTFNSDRDVC